MLIINDILAFILDLIAIFLLGAFFSLTENKFLGLAFAMLAIIIFAIIWANFFCRKTSKSPPSLVKMGARIFGSSITWILFFMRKII